MSAAHFIGSYGLCDLRKVTTGQSISLIKWQTAHSVWFKAQVTTVNKAKMQVL